MWKSLCYFDYSIGLESEGEFEEVAGEGDEEDGEEEGDDDEEKAGAEEV